MINNATLVGRLTKEVELKYTSTGKAVATFTLAVNRPFKKDETDFINVQVWGKPAENTANFTKKGSLVGLTGRIQTRNYENKDGVKVYVVEVVAESVQFLDSKPKNDNQGEYSQKVTKTNDDPFKGQGTKFDIQDSELPF